MAPGRQLSLTTHHPRAIHGSGSILSFRFFVYLLWYFVAQGLLHRACALSCAALRNDCSEGPARCDARTRLPLSTYDLPLFLPAPAPTAAEGAVEADDGMENSFLDVREFEFCLEHAFLGGDHFEIRGITGSEENVRGRHRV